MKVNIVLELDFERLDNVIKRIKETSKDSSKSLDDMFLIMNEQTGISLTRKLFGELPLSYKGIKIAYCDSVDYGTVYIK